MNRLVLTSALLKIVDAPADSVDMDGWATCMAAFVCEAAGMPVIVARRTFSEWLTCDDPDCYVLDGHGDKCDVVDMARRALDITDAEADRLFYVSRWPEDLRDLYEAADETQDYDTMRAAVVSRLDLELGGHIVDGLLADLRRDGLLPTQPPAAATL